MDRLKKSPHTATPMPTKTAGAAASSISATSAFLSLRYTSMARPARIIPPKKDRPDRVRSKKSDHFTAPERQAKSLAPSTPEGTPRMHRSRAISLGRARPRVRLSRITNAATMPRTSKTAYQ